MSISRYLYDGVVCGQVYRYIELLGELEQLRMNETDQALEWPHEN